jgi:hypothetical protein
MNGLFINIGWLVISIKIIALFALLFFSKQSLKEIVKGKPSKGIREQIEYSLLIFTFMSLCFHFFGRHFSSLIVKADIDIMTKNQIYYAFFTLYEMLYVFAILRLHKISDCHVTKICRLGIYLSLATALCQLARYIDRVMFETDVLRWYYNTSVTIINFIVLGLIAIYPTLRIFMTFPNEKWQK